MTRDQLKEIVGTCPTPGLYQGLLKQEFKKDPMFTRKDVGLNYAWDEVEMIDAIRHAQKRTIVSGEDRPKDTMFDEYLIFFEDGTAIAVHSKYSGPLSEVTPDISADEPGWRIFR